MRTLLIIVMMALAPLRAWAGDVMLIGMVAAPVAVAVAAQSAARSAPARGAGQLGIDATTHADCLGHGATAAAAALLLAASQDDVASTHCPTCSFCQVCSSPGLAMTVNQSGSPGFAHAVPLSGGTHFTSAEHTPGLKPPIS